VVDRHAFFDYTMPHMWRRLVVLGILAVACDASDAKHRAAGNLHFQQGHYAEAKAEFEQAVKARPGDAGNHILLGNAHFELEDYPAARREFEEALRLDPDAPEAHRSLAIVIMRAGKGSRAAFGEARPHLEKVLAKNPKDRNAIVSVAQILSENADPADAEAYAAAQREAEELLRRALSLDDRDPRTLFHTALVYARKGDVATALTVAERIERVVKDRPGFAHYTRAIIYTIAGDDEQALSSLDRLLESEKTDPEAWRRDPWLSPLARTPKFAEKIEGARGRAH
jgi:tetratricopeptide (TPR) repeat protein